MLLKFAHLLFTATLFFECSGEPIEGQRLVADVIMNRAVIMSINKDIPYDLALVKVMYAPFQFSCWDSKHLNLNTVMEIRESGGTILLSTLSNIAEKRIDRGEAMVWEDHLDSAESYTKATNYHRDDIHPAWATADCMLPVKHIGHHYFYKDINEWRKIK